MSNDPTIKILVSCHKDVMLPESEVYLPVHVGAAQAKEPLAGMQPDNEGDHISDRNFTFCELSGQYWGWKNLDADYVGQCHYRRFFAFDGQSHPANDHLQMEYPQMSQEAFSLFHLDDTDAIKQAATACDMIVPPLWDVRNAPTPCGPQQTVASHMISYGLLAQEDVDKLVAIVAERQPDYLDDLKRYLDGYHYRGYNCFIMKRALFDVLCAFEFDVLLAFDQQKDYAGLTATQRRICGYLGEILFSVFVAHQQRIGSPVITELPMVFFETTSAALPAPSDDGITIYWQWHDQAPEALSVCLDALAQAVSPGATYRVHVITDNRCAFSRALAGMRALPGNVAIDQIIWPALQRPGSLPPVDDHTIAEHMPELSPWLFPHANAKAIWVCDTVLFNDDPARLLAVSRGAYAALRALKLKRELNKPPRRAQQESYLAAAEAPVYCDPAVCVVDAATARAQHTAQGAIAACQTHAPAVDGLDKAVRQSLSLVKLACETLPFDLACPSLHVVDTATWSPSESVAAWKAASDPLCVSFEEPGVPHADVEYSHNWLFWQAARGSKVYETILRAGVAPQPPTADRTDLVHRLFPTGTLRWRIAKKLSRLLGR